MSWQSTSATCRWGGPGFCVVCVRAGRLAGRGGPLQDRVVCIGGGARGAGCGALMLHCAAQRGLADTSWFWRGE